MAEALLFSPMIVCQYPFLGVGNGAQLDSRGVPPLQRARRSNSSVGGNSRSDSIHRVSSGWSGKCRRWVKAGVSQSRASQLLISTQNSRPEHVENGRVDTIAASAEELNFTQDPRPSDDPGSVTGNQEDGNGGLLQERRNGVLSILARDMEVLRENVGWVEDMLPLVPKTESGVLLNDRVGVDEAELETAETRGAGVLEILSRDGEIIKENVTSAVKNFRTVLLITKQKVRTRFSDVQLQSADESNLALEFQSQKTSAWGKVNEGVDNLKAVKDGLVQASQPLLKWAEMVGKQTGVVKIIQRDVEFIREGINSMQEEVKEVLRMRFWEDTSISEGAPLAWPEPTYSSLSGKDLLAADIEALKSYGNYVKGFLSTWRIPLQLAYDPEAVASYFNRRPHLLLFRFLEVSAAFSGVALQLLLEKARVSRASSTLKNAEALKETLLRLGPTFIKVAQSLSSRPDIIGMETAKVLSELQDRLPPFPTEEAMAVIEMELGVPASRVFSYLSSSPVAAASFGQVYKGRTTEGEEVAVKVQRPDLLFDVALDVYVLRLGLGILRKLAGMNSDISVLADELGYGLFGELDYTLEAANANKFGASLRHLSYVKVPRTLPHLTRKRVLTMEWITGYRPSDLQLIAEGNDLDLDGSHASIDRLEAKLYLDDLVRKGVECSLVQLLETGVMHADPHQGNLLYTREGILVYLDFGLLAHVTKKHQAAMLAVIAHLVNAEWQCLANDFGDLDILKPSTDRFALRLALERAFGEGPDAVVKNGVPDIQFGQVTGKLWKIALKFRFRLPPYYTLVLRALASLEGIAVSVDPGYKVFAAAYPYVVRRLLNDNSQPSRKVLQSLVLTQKGEFRWERIGAIMATSKKGSLDNVSQRTANALVADSRGSQMKQVPDGKDMASVLMAFTLSKEGKPVRRILLEANTKALAHAFVSPSASSLRRKVSVALANSFFLSRSSFRDTGSKRTGTSTDTGYGEGRTMDSLTSTTPLTRCDPLQTGIHSAVNTENWNSSPLLLEPRLSNHRFRFLLKALASRLRSSPILMLRVSWTVVTMVAFAAALAVRRFVISISDRLLRTKSKKAQKVRQKRLDHDISPRLQGDSVYGAN